MSKNTRNRILLTAVAALLLVCVTVGGTLAWLQDATQEVTNTFEPNKVEVDLAESTGTSYEFIPGVNITKDPTVTVTTSVDAYVFLKVVKDTNWPEEATYSINRAWAKVDGYDDVYYTTVSGQEAAHTIGVLTDNTITVPTTMTNTDMPTVSVTLKFQAWAIQKTGWTGTVAEAYAQASNTTAASGN